MSKKKEEPMRLIRDCIGWFYLKYLRSSLEGIRITKELGFIFKVWLCLICG